MDPKILIIDDDESLVNSLSQSLKQILPNAKILGALGGFEANDTIREMCPHLIFLDVHLPGIDGHDICRLIRLTPELEDVKILAMSGGISNDELLSLTSEGINDFIPKPFRFEILKEKVKKHLHP